MAFLDLHPTVPDPDLSSGICDSIINHPLNDILWQDASFWNVANGDSSSSCWNNEPFFCCGDDSNEYAVHRYVFDYLPLFKSSLVSFPTNTNDKACCGDESDCAYSGTCYDLGLRSVNGENVFCFGYMLIFPSGTWGDLDSSSNLCTTLQTELQPFLSETFETHWSSSGEISVGEYDAQGGGEQCCGDDSNEYYKTCQKSSNVAWECLTLGALDKACCAADDKCIVPSNTAATCAKTLDRNNDANDEKVICQGTGVSAIWHDCDESQAICNSCAVQWPGNVVYVSSGEGALFGEYATPFASGCCGDDGDEYPKGGICCNSPYDVNVGGICDSTIDVCGGCGDVNNDGVVNYIDVNAATDIMNGLEPRPTNWQGCLDTNLDGDITASDIADIGAMQAGAPRTNYCCQQSPEQCGGSFGSCCPTQVIDGTPENLQCSIISDAGQTVAYPHCCPIGKWWFGDATDGICIDTEPCGIRAGLDCNYYPPNDPSGGQLTWWLNLPNCINPNLRLACCYVPERAGETDVYYADVDSVLPYP